MIAHVKTYSLKEKKSLSRFIFRLGGYESSCHFVAISYSPANAKTVAI